MNKILEFYKEKKISPVHQDISNFDLHCARREKLYRQLGMPQILFKGKRLLEVGAGGGYNSIVFSKWGAMLDIVEPNETGQQDIIALFDEMGMNNYRLHSTSIEEFDVGKYDIVIAEGFIQTIENNQEVLKKLKSLVNEKGLLVITCQDEMGMFVERMKRLVGNIATKETVSFDEKVKGLVQIFEPQLKKLRGASRPPEDWVLDQMLCEDFNCRDMLTLKVAIQLMGDEWDVLGCSGPQLFGDFSWYKEIEYDYKLDYYRQYEEKLYNLLIAGRTEVDVSEINVRKIKNLVYEIRDLAIDYETLGADEKNIGKIIDLLKDILCEVREKDTEFAGYLEDLIEILGRGDEKINYSEYPFFCGCFGRSQQYISFIKTGIKE